MQLNETIREHVLLALPELFEGSFSPADFQVSQTKPEFEGDYTVVLFSLVKLLKKSPDEIGKLLGQKLTEKYSDLYTGYSLLKGFMNLTIAEPYWVDMLV